MKLNMGSVDRTLRLVASVALVFVILLVTEGTLSWILGAVALVLATTSAVGTCPLYLPFGFSTRPRPAA